VTNLALYVVTLLVLMLVRRFSRWQITEPDGKDGDSMYLAHHYGIHHLLMLTAIVALACSLFRSVLTIFDAGFPYQSGTEFIIDLGILLVIVFPVCVVPWITLTSRGNRAGSAIVTLVVAAALDYIACYISVLITSSWNFAQDVAFSCGLMQIGAILSAVGTTLVLRYCGYKMVREAATKS
jgi:hypothetical protein